MVKNYIREEDRTPEAMARARRFFNLYDALPEGERNKHLSEVACKAGIDRSTAFRYTRFARAQAAAEQDPWPYVPAAADEEGAVAVDTRPHKTPTPVEAFIEQASNRLNSQVIGALERGEGDYYDELAAQTIREGEEVPAAERMDSRLYRDEARKAYIAFLSQKQKPIVIPFELDQWMRKAYSDWDGHPMRVEEICDKAGLTVEEFNKYRSLRRWHRKMNPLDPENALVLTVDEATDEILAQRDAAIRAKFRKRMTEQDRKDAEKWRTLNVAVLERLDEAIRSIPAQRLERAPVARPARREGRQRLILPLNDWQVGSYADERDLRFGRQFDEHTIRRMVQDYCRQLVDYVEERPGARWGQPIVPLLGDILHGLIGETVHGTKLAKHMRQFDAHQTELAIELLLMVTDLVMELFGGMKIIPLPGNHDGAAVNLLAEIAYQRWRSEGAEIVRHTNRTHFEMVGSSLFVFDHGATHDSNVQGGKIPKTGLARDLAVKDLVLTRADLVQQVKSRRGGVYFVQGDQHYTVDEISAHVEVIKLPALASGDVYADHNGWHSRPAQGVLLVDESYGLKHFERFYLDNELVFPG